MKTIHIIGGGTFSPVRNHLALSAMAFGGTARRLYELFNHSPDLEFGMDVELHLTKMADPESTIVTNDDVEALIDSLIIDPSTKVIIMSAALCDYAGTIGEVASGSHAERLKTSAGNQLMQLNPATKIIAKIRKQRKDIFVVGFKTTTNASDQDQYQAGLSLLKTNSLNLVLANDTVTRKNVIITPEESTYAATTSRYKVLKFLVKMVNARAGLTFTRSTVIDAPACQWNRDNVPRNLYETVNHLIDNGAYKPFLGKTVGHFAYKAADGSIITSRRKSNFNELESTGMIKIVADGHDKVIAYGGKPSVGGQSQRIIFDEHPELDCIAHAHIPIKEESKGIIPIAEQWPYECGSHECGQNTSGNLKEVEPGIWAVYLENHGPNVVFNKSVPSEKVIAFLDKHFDLAGKTGGVFSEEFKHE